MVACILRELQDWRADGFRRALLVSVVAAAIAGAASFLRPMVVVTALMLVSLGAGWRSGNRLQAAGAARAAALGRGASPLAIAAGKALAGACEFALCAFITSPPLALMSILWALPPAAAAACAASCLAAFLASLALGLVASLLYAGSDALFGVGLTALWLLPGFVWRPAAMSNPFRQVWAILRSGISGEALLGVAGVLAAAAALVALVARVIASERRKADA